MADAPISDPPVSLVDPIEYLTDGYLRNSAEQGYSAYTEYTQFTFVHSCSMHLHQTLLSAILLSGLASAANSNSHNSPGCDKPLPKAQEPGKSHNVTDFTTEDGRKRSYIVHIPSNYDQSKAVPLIFSFHGRHKTAGGQEDLSQFSNEDWNPDAIAVYPQGIDVRFIAWEES